MNRAPTPPPSRRSGAKSSFGRISVSVQGRVMVSVAEGPFDAGLMAAVQRAISLAGKRLPEDRRFVDLVEIRGNMQMDANALTQLRQSIEAFTSRGVAPIATIFVVQPGIPGIERLPAMLDIWRSTRPVRRADNLDAAWDLLNSELAAAGLPTQPVPQRG